MTHISEKKIVLPQDEANADSVNGSLVEKEKPRGKGRKELLKEAGPRVIDGEDDPFVVVGA